MGGNTRHRLKYFLRRFASNLRTWHLILALVPLLFITATLLRFDHIKMAKLRDTVIAADELGDQEAIRQSLDDLRKFTFSHIVINISEQNGRENITFGTGVFYLEKSYIRDANAAIAEAEKKIASSSSTNGNIFAAASEVCKPIAAAHGWQWNSEGYLKCMTGEIDKHPTSTEISTTLLANVPSTELYRVEFSSPTFTFSLSGIFIILCSLIIVVILTRFLIWLILKITLFFL